MTDKEKYIALLKGFGIPYTERTFEYKGRVINEVMLREDGRRCWGDDDIKVEGYGSFYCTFEFDEDGKFDVVGIWE